MNAPRSWPAVVPLPHTGGPPCTPRPQEPPCGECRRLDTEGWRALFADELDELKAVNERQARHYTEAHTMRAAAR
ncbi:hypothetical protein QZH56_29260 [Streptomyces olivoreticuli]|uniref:hypothetical protein n=1 Tax=Streptomyces olivoreticuli TaxID=68246 RepID=UPI00265A57BF|nr:hypothetical protein [Streptomyces olivoreticuli]WKK22808.1 hypothetical protein QZH56_29260 [Streptomyces olivoreticuli]